MKKCSLKEKVNKKISLMLLFTFLFVSFWINPKSFAIVRTGLIGENVEAEYDNDTQTLKIRSINGVKGTIDRDMWKNYLRSHVARFGGDEFGNHYVCEYKTLIFENPVYAPENCNNFFAGGFPGYSGDFDWLGDYKARFCTKIENLNYFDTCNTTDMSYMFFGSIVEDLDLRSFDTSKVTTMKDMFASAKGVKNLNIVGCDTSQVTDMSFMFYAMEGLESFNISGLNTSNVTNMSYMFAYIRYYDFKNVDLSSFNTSKVRSMKYMFYDHKETTELDLTHFKTGNVTNMSYMFSYMAKIKTLNLANWDVTNVTDMSRMFQGNQVLESLNLTNWKPVNVIDMQYMFNNCRKFVTMDLSDWELNKLNNANYMFENCLNLKEIKLFKSNSVLYVQYTFRNCPALELVDARYITPLDGVLFGPRFFGLSTNNVEPTSKLKEIYTFYGIPDTVYDDRSYFGLPPNEIYINIDDDDPNIYKTSINVKVSAPLHLVHGNIVTLETNGGVVNSGNVTKYRYEEETILPTDVTKDGYSFAGWYLEEDFSGEKQTKVLSTDTGAKKFYAKWEIVDYTIGYDAGGGNLTGQKTSYTIEDDDFTLVKPNKDKYTFTGWIDENYMHTPERELTIRKGSFGNKFFKAKYVKTFELSGYSIGGKFKDTLEDIFTNNIIDFTLTTENVVVNGPVTKDMVIGYDINGQDDTQNLKVEFTYDNVKYEDNIVLNLRDYITDLDITKPNKLEYKIGEMLDLDGGKIKPIMASERSASIVDMTDGRVSIDGFDSSVEGTVIVVIEFGGIRKEFEVKIIDLVTAIRLKNLPHKLEYELGENINLDGGKLEITKESLNVEEIDITEDMISGFDKNKEGNQEITITYKGFTEKFNVNVVKKEENNNQNENNNNNENNNGNNNNEDNNQEEDKKIIINVEDDYEIGDELDIDGLFIRIIFEGEEKIIPVTIDMIRGFDSSTEGRKIVTINYDGTETSFEVVVHGKKAQEKIKGALTTEKKEIDKFPILLGIEVLFALTFFLLLILTFRENVKIYVKEDGNYILFDKGKIKVKKARLNLDEYFSKDEDRKIRIILNKKISRKLDGKSLKVRYKREIKEYEVSYDEEPFSIDVK